MRSLSVAIGDVGEKKAQWAWMFVEPLETAMMPIKGLT